ncbi:MAG: 16S rRNA (adenine(1518)-N(6)/adenine(1519)-N(6))-dimethyltransferase RsmA [Planctomycetota bacterium]|nr:16S rRNA (adenine(1518)-N(6)/adenine(1519)-N(6))-dimethyltransferase RsmA [Planctomycetota bacterium]
MSELVPKEGGRPQWSVFKAALETRGFRPSRRFGQNFLLDENMVRAIVRDAGVGPGDRVLEVGSGCGFLSLQLLRAGVDLVSVEVDARLVEITRELLANEPRFRLVEGDVLASKHVLAPTVLAALPLDAPWHLVSNLPYSVSGPVMACAADLVNAPASMTVLVQKEMALRVAAQPATDDWGPLSVRLQVDYTTELVRDVPSGLFWPRPKVESSVVRLTRRPEPWPVLERRALSRLVDELFQRRRQSLGRVLGDLCTPREVAREWIERAGLEPAMRAEDLDLATLRRLVRADPREPDR